jgi:hypothetical protein
VNDAGQSRGLTRCAGAGVGPTDTQRDGKPDLNWCSTETRAQVRPRQPAGRRNIRMRMNSFTLIFAICLAIASLCGFASAHLHPTLATFMQRDTTAYPDGASLAISYSLSDARAASGEVLLVHKALEVKRSNSTSTGDSCTDARPWSVTYGSEGQCMTAWRASHTGPNGGRWCSCSPSGTQWTLQCIECNRPCPGAGGPGHRHVCAPSGELPAGQDWTKCVCRCFE